MQKDKIMLLFPDGVGIKNYLYSDVFKDTKEEIVLFHNFDQHTIQQLQQEVPFSGDLKIPVYKETLKEKLLRELICLARLNYNSKKVNNPTLLYNWKKNHKGIAKQLFYHFIERVAIFIRSYSLILRLEKEYQSAIRKTAYYKTIKAILQKERPKLIFCAHQRAVQAAPIFAAAKDLGIKTTTVIYSWDNLPKARLALIADKYLVWSDYMKNELQLYYPEILEKAMMTTGTPQFECYENHDSILEKLVFYQKYNLDPAKKIICYSGDDVKTSPDDPQYLDDLADELKKANWHHEFQILLRRCPVDVSGRFDEVIKKYPDIIKEATPLWHFSQSKEWNSVYPTRADVTLLVSTAFYADVVINVGSTMAFDFAMYHKPCIFINYDQADKKDKEWTVKTIYQFQHFRSMPSKEAVFWLNDKADVVKIMKLALNQTDNLAMQQWKNIVLGDYKKASAQIKKTII